MSKSLKRLGRGLDSLVSHLSDGNSQQDLRARMTDDADHIRRTSPEAIDRVIQMEKTENIRPNPYQPRSTIDDNGLSSLSVSVKRNGILQPICVRQVGQRYEIIAGERRWRAAKSAGLSHIPMIVRDANDEQMLELALIENIQREDLNAIDRAKAYRRYCDTFGLKVEEIAERIGEDRSTVANYVRLLDLPDTVQQMVARGTLAMGHARCLLGIAEPERRIQLADTVVRNQLSVRALEELVRRERTRGTQSEGTSQTVVRTIPARLSDIQRRFEEAVRTKVVIHEGKRKGTGRILIEYHSLDEFDRLASLMGVSLD